MHTAQAQSSIIPLRQELGVQTRIIILHYIIMFMQ